MRSADLPCVGPGEWGWCLLEGDPLDDEPPRLAYYDDDESACSEDLDEDDETHECGGPGSACSLESRAVVYLGDPYDVGAYRLVPHDMLRAVPSMLNSTGFDPAVGFVYAIAVVPEVDIRRLKIGHTKGLIGKRLASYRTANPTAMVVGLWSAGPAIERVAHDACCGRIGSSEVFQVDDLAGSLARIDAAIRRAA